jgi:hypothetical protein
MTAFTTWLTYARDAIYYRMGYDSRIAAPTPPMTTRVLPPTTLVHVCKTPDLARYLFSFNTLKEGAHIRSVSRRMNAAFPSPLKHWNDRTVVTLDELDHCARLTDLSHVALMRLCPNLRVLTLTDYPEDHSMIAKIEDQVRSLKSIRNSVLNAIAEMQKDPSHQNLQYLNAALKAVNYTRVSEIPKEKRLDFEQYLLPYTGRPFCSEHMACPKIYRNFDKIQHRFALMQQYQRQRDEAHRHGQGHDQDIAWTKLSAHEGAYGMAPLIYTLSAHCPRLTHLDIINSRGETTFLSFGLSMLPSSLLHLHMDSYAIQRQNFKDISRRCPNLETLSLRYMSIILDFHREQEPLLDFLLQFKSLSSLSIEGDALFREEENPMSLARMPGTLTTLKLSYTALDDDTLESIVNAHPLLTYVDVSHTKVTVAKVHSIMEHCTRLINFKMFEHSFVRNRDQLHYVPTSSLGKLYRVMDVHRECMESPFSDSAKQRDQDQRLIALSQERTGIFYSLSKRDQDRLCELHRQRGHKRVHWVSGKTAESRYGYDLPEHCDTFNAYLQLRYKESDEEALLTHVWELAGRPPLAHPDDRRHYAHINPMRLADALARLDAH